MSLNPNPLMTEDSGVGEGVADSSAVGDAVGSGTALAEGVAVVAGVADVAWLSWAVGAQAVVNSAVATTKPRRRAVRRIRGIMARLSD
jgi:hypothetical protein